MKRYSTIVALAFASGCAGLSEQHAELAAYKDEIAPTSPSDWAVSIPESAPEADWISQFGSSNLQELINEALNSNFDIRSAQATARAFRATARAADGRKLPSISASADYTHSEFGDAVLFFGNPDSYGLGLSATWEPDFWQRLSKTADAADADLLASEADLATLRLSISGAVARGWINLANARAQLNLALDEMQVRDRSRILTERRFSAGVSTSLDVRLARSALETTRANIASSRLAVADAQRALEVLLGRYPSAQITAPESPMQLGPIQDASSPTDLLARRPDVSAAEARMAAAGLRADLARLAMVPRLSLTGTLDTDSENLADVIDVDFLAGRVLANLTAPIFNGGALRADAEAARAQAEGAIDNYASTVLTAWQEVEGARHADIFLAEQESALTNALEEAKAAEDLADRQYQSGLISIFNLIDAQTTRISSEAQLLNTRANRASNRVNYHIALGGGVSSNATLQDQSMQEKP